MDFFISSKQLYTVCGLRPDAGAGGILGGLGMAAEAHVDKVTTLARWLLQAAVRYPTNILYRLNNGGLCPRN